MRPLSRHEPLWHRASSYTSRHALAPLNSCSCYRHSRATYSSHSHSHSRPQQGQHPLIFPEAPAGSEHHHDLASYAAYAARTGLDPASKTFVGTRYEYVAAAALARLGFSLRRVGGRADRGIDLLGVWRVPSPSTSSTTSSSTCPPLRVLLQCKASSARSTRVGPHLVRELEGAFAGAPAGWRGSGSTGVLGLLVTQKPATRGVRDALARSRWPMGYVSCSEEGRLEQVLWNERAGREGLEGLGVAAAVRFAEGEGEAGRRPEKQLVLTWKGKPVVFDEPPAGELS
ncbi:hypothetical protein F4820DRAFT_425505 [Hypoxylon rubiginosum]|uniref:Uncharacterized protein n=1 Tax=Hypoxylon rubiginosum TaxID=110542 RepID=A0ACB9YXI6_9PEZI|nr:hypothetical protein F4820DRAFT_425505 [Hypoxylon rubiginosum]